MLNVYTPVKIKSVMSERAFLCLTSTVICLALGHNTATPPASEDGIKSNATG